MGRTNKATLAVNLAAALLAVGALVYLWWRVQPEHGLWALGIGAILLGLLAQKGFQPQGDISATSKKFRFYFAFLPILLFVLYAYAIQTFGYFDWSAILLHADGGALTPGVALDYAKHSGPVIGVALTILLGFGFLKGRGMLPRSVDLVLFALLLAVNPIVTGPISAAMYTDPLAGYLATRFVDVSALARKSASESERPKNLLHIYIESAERTYFNEREFGDVMQPLAEFEKRGLTATNLTEVQFTQNSIAGMVATNCGVPLLMPPFMTKRYLEESGEFLPGVTCLGDILKARGYEQSLISGWPIEFTGQGIFYKNHGFTGLFGAAEVNKAAPGNESPYGADDAQIMEMTLQLLRKSRGEGKPFSIVSAVTGGHATDGYLTKRCIGKTGVPADQPNILHAVKCTNMLIADMLHRAEAEGLLDNTIVVLQSDHLSQPSTVSDRLKKFERRNFFSISGPGIEPQTQARMASMPDAFPTILDALDIPAPDGRAGLAASLFINQETLVGELGLPAFDKALQADTALRAVMWGRDNKSIASLKH